MGVGGQSHAPAALPPGNTRYPLYRRLGEPQGRSGQVWKISPPPGFDPRTVQPVTSRYTDWAILAHGAMANNNRKQWQKFLCNDWKWRENRERENFGMEKGCSIIRIKQKEKYLQWWMLRFTSDHLAALRDRLSAPPSVPRLVHLALPPQLHSGLTKGKTTEASKFDKRR
jgi:hypothetical protein